MSTRWIIRGHLRTQGPLHLGSGDTCFDELVFKEVRDAKTKRNKREPVEISGVARDHRAWPYLPATSIRGALRGWVKRGGFPSERLRSLFGDVDTQDAEAAAGRVRFSDALLTAIADPATPPPIWRSERGTGVIARVSIDRLHRTASAQRLFNVQVVPAGQRFAIEISVDGDLTDVAMVILGLEAFNAGGGPRLGARSQDDWGRLAWRLDGVFRLGEGEIQRWLAGGAREMVHKAATPLSADLEGELQAAKEALQEESTPQHGRLELGLTLKLEGPFLVKDHDPARTGGGSELPNGAPRRDHQSRVILPASSLRGALRGQAERILRTLGGPGAACGVDAPRAPCPPPRTLDEVKNLCPACQLFGATGWRTPIHLTDCRTTEPLPDRALVTQEFVAIDRFTGGAAEKKKFKLIAPVGPSLEGSLTLDLGALTAAQVGAWSLALLALTLRDLEEGDIPLGGGGARGYGRGTAVITPQSSAWWQQVPPPPAPRPAESEPAESRQVEPEQSLDQVLAQAGEHLQPFPDLTDLNEAYRRLLSDWIADLGSVAQESHAAWAPSSTEEPAEAQA